MDIYQKPGFRFVALDAGTTSAACSYSISAAWQICPVVVKPELGPKGTVFSDYPDPCGRTAEFYKICQHTGNPGSNVFGS